ncbi:hypothetical protein [Metapseudomonas furukawaii]|uniref:hypothetical protein n=1 Tax=Metapseudomonas furukawaii TaxID=1149133 RepID=UPI0002F88860|nr:hypothetical protein [Pseudomonas furukawaii]WAG80902.1 hypothetical protein LMK08_09635 [Pseudomonas furukawaii]
MKLMLQRRLQSQVDKVLPGFIVKCEYSSGRVINICLRNPATLEALRITGVTLESLVGQGVLDEVVDQLMFEITTVAGGGR